MGPVGVVGNTPVVEQVEPNEIEIGQDTRAKPHRPLPRRGAPGDPTSEEVSSGEVRHEHFGATVQSKCP